MARFGWTCALLLCTAVVFQLTYAQDASFRNVEDFCLACICQASTGCQARQCADLGGITFCGAYQISRAYWLDAGQPAVNQGSQSAFEECALDQKCSENTVRRYLVKYVRNCNRDSVLDCEDVARLHKAGPFACDQPALESTPYWKGFLDCWYGEKK